MKGNHLFDHMIPPAAGSGQSLQQGLELAVRDLLVFPGAGRQRFQFSGHSHRCLGIDHSIHQSQHIQQGTAPLFRRNRQQSLQSGMDLGKNRAGSSQRGQALLRTLEAKVLI